MSTYNQIIITPVQLRMARAALKMTVRELGELSGIAPNTVTRIENGRTKAQAGSMQAFAKVFRERGLLFVAGDDLAGPGVRLAH
ncbi:helix-turn-helix transcriptional regulator [Sneathiella sp.]|uniref:helix-turn-helix domain-containing protein n=1 Tax=Sneathiella sp. TaxID=1964365 RepID=UPI002636D612|nr:helix-turn-helix transcriptional regulator [Sneathiella sp.]MDF2366313.1 helix-turn-helix transcriptional regulator [Sneathiella sp.]